MSNFKGKKVLIFDNKQKQLSLYENVFQGFFGEYDYFTNEDDAFSVYKQGFYNVVFINISNNNSINFIKKIRKLTKNKPIVLFSDNANNNTINLYHSYYIDGFICYPFLKKHLSTLLENIFDRQEEQDVVFSYLRELEKKKILKQTDTETQSVYKILLENYENKEIISAKTMFSHFDESIIDKVDEINYLINTINDSIFQIDINVDHPDVVSKHFKRISESSFKLVDTLFYFQYFKIPENAFQEFGNMTKKASECEFDENTLKNVIHFFYMFEKDLTDWANSIFMRQTADNIYYFDFSLLSNIKTLENVLFIDAKHQSEDIDWF